MLGPMKEFLAGQLDEIREGGLFKGERVIAGPQRAVVELQDGEPLLNMCANNYLGLASHPDIIAAAHEALDQWGYGMASVRFICGTQVAHKELERKISEFLGTEDTLLYSSCFDANTGLFETLLSAEDAILSDELNHASIIDGVRLCKAQRFRYKNNDMASLEENLQEARGARHRLIATDGVFSMDGTIPDLGAICDLADKHDAAVMIDDSHAVGFMGENGRGTHEYCGVMGRVDIITGTLGKALGGASGGYTSGRQEVIDILRQRSRPYLFSNSVAPTIVGTSLKVLGMLAGSGGLRETLHATTKLFRQGMTARGFDIAPGDHPIVPIMLGDAALAARMAEMMLARGVYVIAFSYPVVPKGKARIRVQLSAAHAPEELTLAMDAFADVKTELGI
ncbi:MAG TPA: glycine C-acetyltransferase [Armatimonadota bacterium]|nr:glycine C-acetyltransferase [Armatimonadota bacterium]